MKKIKANLIAGIGNVLMGDDGLGVWLAHLLTPLNQLADVEVLDMGTAGMEWIGLFERREKVIIVDGLDSGAKPGRILRLTPNEIGRYLRPGISQHDIHLLDALQTPRLLKSPPKQVVIFAVQVQRVHSRVGLSGAVQKALLTLTSRILAEIGYSRKTLREQAIAIPRTLNFFSHHDPLLPPAPLFEKPKNTVSV